MRKFIMSAVLIGILFFTGVARAESYISAYVGAAFPHDEEVDKGGLLGTEEYDTVPSFGIKLGNWFTEQNVPYLGVQIDLNIFKSTANLRADSDALRGGAPSNAFGEGNFTMRTVTGNILLRKPGGGIRPHVGVGVGWFSREDDTFDITFFSDDTGGVVGTGRRPAETKTDIGWQALAGVDLDVTRRFSVFGEYRYSNVESFSIQQVYGGLAYHL